MKDKETSVRNFRAKLKPLIAAMLPLLLFGAGQPAMAVDTTWDGSTDNNWFDASNWDTNAVPTTVDNTFINNGTVDILSAGAVSDEISVGSSGSLDISNGGMVSNTAGFIGVGGSGSGTVTVDGAGSTWTNSAQLVVGGSGSGTVTIENGGTVSNTDGRIGAGGTGTVTVTGAGSTWTNSSNLFVGQVSAGTLTIENGGTVSNTEGRIGLFAFSSGTVTVDGATWTNTRELNVGDFGTGTLTIENGGTVSNIQGRIGRVFSGTGTVTVNGATSTWTNRVELSVGDFGTGTLTIENGGMVSSTVGRIGSFAGSSGTVTVDGATWTNNGVLFVGQEGTGTLTIENGGTVAVGSTVTIANAAASAGTVALDGTAGSRGVLVAPQVVRGAGTGTLDFDGGVLRLTADQASLFNGFAAGDVTLNAGGAFIDTQNFTAGTAAVLDGAGGLTKQGTGTLLLTGTNTYSGGTLIDAGTLSINGDDRLGSGTVTLDGGLLSLGVGVSTLANNIQVNATGGTLYEDFIAPEVTGNITLDGNLLVDGASTFTLEGNISGTGALTSDMSSDLIILGDATHTGGTTINTGILEIGNSGTIGSISGDIASNTQINFNRSDNLTYGGVISGAGIVIKNGAGTLTLNGDHTYSGDTTIAAGTLEFTGSTAGLGGNITNDTALTFNQAANSSFAGVISSTGTLTKDGAGILTLTGANTYSGATTINGGSLLINGSIANSTTTVNGGGILGGTGTVGTVNVSGGTFAPGNSIGTLNVAGDVDFTGGGIYEVEVDDAGNSDLINATGTATLTSGTVSVIPLAGNYNLTTDYTILTAAGGLGGTTFNSVNSTLAFLTPSLTYDANNVFLNLRRNDVSFNSVAGTPNQINVSTVINQLNNTNPAAIQQLLDQLFILTVDGTNDAYDSLSGVQHANIQSILLNLNSPFQQLLFDRLFNTNFASADTQVTGVNAGDAALSGKGAWMKGYGNFGDIDDTSNASGADYNTYGVAFGVDWPLSPALTAGIAAGYANTSVDPFNGDADVDSYQIAAYAGWQQENYYVNADVNYGHHSIDSDRQVIAGALAATAQADYDADQFGVNVEGGKVIPLNNNTSLTPFVGVDYAHLERDSFTETGAGAANLSVQEQDEDSLRTKLGVRLSHTLETNNQTKITPSLAIAYVREHLDNVSRVQSGFTGAANNTFLIDGPELDRNRVALNAGVTASFSEHSHLNIGYSGELAGSDDHHAVSATFRYEW